MIDGDLGNRESQGKLKKLLRISSSKFDKQKHEQNRSVQVFL
jgi:hypothetical protein